jgi:hypothetical protein
LHPEALTDPAVNLLNLSSFSVIIEGFGRPVLRNLGEQAVLDGIPLGGAGRVVSDGGDNAEGITYLSLKFDLPGPGSAAVATAGVGQNQ